MAILRLKRLPTDSDVALLRGIGIHQFIDQFNANAVDATRALVEVVHEGHTIAMGDMAWEHSDNITWYEIEESPNANNQLYLVEAFWFDPMENRNAYGWKPIGIVRGDDEKDRVEDIGGYKVADHPYPLKQAVEFEKCIPNDSPYVPCYRCVPVEDLTNMGSLIIADIKQQALTTLG